jgi:hypothetical protein
MFGHGHLRFFQAIDVIVASAATGAEHPGAEHPGAEHPGAEHPGA